MRVFINAPPKEQFPQILSLLYEFSAESQEKYCRMFDTRGIGRKGAMEDGRGTKNEEYQLSKEKWLN